MNPQSNDQASQSNIDKLNKICNYKFMEYNEKSTRSVRCIVI